MRCNTAWTSRTRADRSNTKCQSVGCQALSVSRQEEIRNLSYKTIYIESTLRDTGWWPLFHRRTRYESYEILSQGSDLSSPCERNRRSKITFRKEQTSRDTLLRETDKITFRVLFEIRVCCFWFQIGPWPGQKRKSVSSNVIIAVFHFQSGEIIHVLSFLSSKLLGNTQTHTQVTTWNWLLVPCSSFRLLFQLSQTHTQHTRVQSHMHMHRRNFLPITHSIS